MLGIFSHRKTKEKVPEDNKEENDRMLSKNPHTPTNSGAKFSPNLQHVDRTTPQSKDNQVYTTNFTSPASKTINTRNFLSPLSSRDPIQRETPSISKQSNYFHLVPKFSKSVLFGLAATNGIALNSAFRNQKTPIDTAKQLFPGDLIPNKTSNKQDFELNGADTESFLQTMGSTAEFHSPGSFVSHRIPISKITKSIKLPCSNTNTRPGWVSDRTHLKEYKRGILVLIPPYTLNRFNSR